MKYYLVEVFDHTSDQWLPIKEFGGSSFRTQIILDTQGRLTYQEATERLIQLAKVNSLARFRIIDYIE